MPTLRCPFRLLSSHSRNEQGFKALQDYRIGDELHVDSVQCLGLQLDHFALTPKSDNFYLMEVTAPSLTEAEALGFIDRLEVALTALFGMSVQASYYGTPYVEFDRYNMELVVNPNVSPAVVTEGPPGHFSAHITSMVRVSDTLSMKITHNFPLLPDAVASLTFNPLQQLYADGLRAATAESKFFHWFIILEEFLEKSKTLSKVFTPLFSKQDKFKVNTLADGLGDGRKKGALVGVLKQTLEARHEKLATILTTLGISTITPPSGAVTITSALCKRLVDQRNELFHRGAHIDDELLYQVLFPIVTKLAACSHAITALQ